MKKLLFIVSFIFLICACTKPEPTPAPTPTKQSQNIPLQTLLTEPLPVSMTESSCKMGEYDCWDIIQDIKNETETSPARKGASNPALEKKGLLIIKFFRSGGSQFYTLSNRANIIIYNNEFNEKRGTQGYISITDPINKKLTIYDSMGNIKNTKNVFTESSCKIGEYDCWDIIKDIKQISKSKEEALLTLEKKGILLISADMYSDGGSLIYLLSNGVRVFINYEMFSDKRGNRGHTTITDPNTYKSITYDTEGNIVSFKE